MNRHIGTVMIVVAVLGTSWGIWEVNRNRAAQVAALGIPCTQMDLNVTPQQVAAMPAEMRQKYEAAAAGFAAAVVEKHNSRVSEITTRSTVVSVLIGFAGLALVAGGIMLRRLDSRAR